MREGPSEPACRSRLQTTLSCIGQEPLWLASGKRRPERRQVRYGKTNESEPLMKCRNTKDGVRTGGSRTLRDKFRGRPVYCLSGVRHADGVSPYQASVRNLGTCRPDVKGEIQTGSTCEDESTDAGHRGGMIRSSDEALVMRVERRGHAVRAESAGQPAMGGAGG